MSDWGDTVRLRPPSRCYAPNRQRNDWIDVDACLVDAVALLWSHGYATLSACCGHGRGGGEIIVAGRLEGS